MERRILLKTSKGSIEEFIIAMFMPLIFNNMLKSHKNISLEDVMIFSTYEFILVFLPIVFIGYYLLNYLKYNELSKLWLALCSFYFYAQGSPDFFPFFLASVFGNYVLGSSLSNIQGDSQKLQRKFLLAVGVLANVALLGYYKDTDFRIKKFYYNLRHYHHPLKL